MFSIAFLNVSVKALGSTNAHSRKVVILVSIVEQQAPGAGPGFKIWVFNFSKDDVSLQPKLYIHNT